MLTDDHAPFLAEFGQTVQRTGSPDFMAMMDMADESMFGTGAVTNRTLLYPASTTPALAAGEVLVIAGASYKLTRDPARHIDDGAWMTAQLVAV